MNLDKVIIAGNLCATPEVSYTSGGTAISKVRLAVNRFWKTGDGERKEEVVFFTISVFGLHAENAAKNLVKGQELCIEGRHSFEEWVDKATGEKRHRLGLVAENLHYGRKPNAKEVA